jgi:glycosyltransferase involved in cell wall biosynthesis
VLPDCSVFVPALEAEAYRKAGARNVVAVPNEVQGITQTRNWILRNTRDRWVVMIDDDVRTHGYVKLLERAAMKVTLDAAQWLAEFRKIFEVTAGVGYRIWGVATDGAARPSIRSAGDPMSPHLPWASLMMGARISTRAIRSKRITSSARAALPGTRCCLC